MFTADISWSDDTVETVGSRKERLERERSQSIKSSNSSSRNSGSSRRNLTKKPSKAQSLNVRQSSVSSISPRNISVPPIPQLEEKYLDIHKSSRTPNTYNGSLLSTARHKFKDDDLESVHSRFRGMRKQSLNSLNTNCTRRMSQETQESRDLQEEVMDQVCEIQRLSPTSFISRTTTRSSEIMTPEDHSTSSPSTDDGRCKDYLDMINRASYSVQIRSRFSPDSSVSDLSWNFVPSLEVQPKSLSVLPIDAWRAPHNWDIVPPTPTSLTDAGNSVSSDPPHRGNYTSVEANTGGLTHFQRFIRRMQTGSPKVILDRLNEEWSQPSCEDERDNLALEKHLWVLTAFQLRSQSQMLDEDAINDLIQDPSKGGDIKRKQILELYGNLAEAYQASAMNPYDRIQYLSTRQQCAIPLPCNVSYLTVPHAGIVPLPYPSESFDQIRSSCLPALIPLTKLPVILPECFRLLSPGGTLELRVVSPSPLADTMGPKLSKWIEENLLFKLERTFRSVRPAQMMPKWIQGAGFRVDEPNHTITLPIATDAAKNAVDEDLAVHVARAMWADVWGQHVEERHGQHHWWWHEEELVQECVELGTLLEITTIVATRPW